MVSIDELHLVSEWRNFRPEYYNLAVLRRRLPDGMVFAAGSATLDPQTMKTVKEACEFDNDTVIVKTDLDRPEIFYQVTQIKEAAGGMLDLQCVFPKNVTHYRDVPKTIVFMDSVSNIKQACALARRWMIQLGYPRGSSNLVAPFFADMEVSIFYLVMKALRPFSFALHMRSLGEVSPSRKTTDALSRPLSLARLPQPRNPRRSRHHNRAARLWLHLPSLTALRSGRC